MTNEELSQKILNDIQYIKEKSEVFQKKLVDFKLDENQLKEIRSVLNYFRTNDFTFISTLNNQEGLLNLENQFSPYKISIEAFLDVPTQQRLNNFLANNSKMYEFMANVINAIKEQFTPTIQGTDIDQFVKLQNNIGKLKDELSKVHANSEQTILNQSLINKRLDDIQSSDAQIEITKILKQANQLFEKAKNSEQLVNKEVQNLKDASQKHVAYTLSEQFSDKCDKLKKEVNQNLIALTVSLVLFLAWNTLLFLGFYSQWFNIEYWQFIVFKITLNIPFALYLGITFNEYSKSKKLYEEYEHKRIMAATLVNNLERLKNELHADEKDLLELIKVPFEKIFDNPVHSIYGDKSGDKNIGLDQLEKITSIIEKMKKGNQSNP